MTATTKKQSKSVAILDVLAASGKRGMRFSEVQRALWDMSHDDGSKPPRGYWCTGLLGDMYRSGLLRTYARKCKDGRWRRNRKAHRGHPWAGPKQSIRPMRATYSASPTRRAVDPTGGIVVGASYELLAHRPGEGVYPDSFHPGDVITVTAVKPISNAWGDWVRLEYTGAGKRGGEGRYLTVLALHASDDLRAI